MVWISIYYFTFEILLVKTTILNEDTPMKKRGIMLIKFSAIVIMTLLASFALEINFSLSDNIDQSSNPGINISIILLSFKVILDILIEVLFVFLVVFMINFKQKHTKLSV